MAQSAATKECKGKCCQVRPLNDFHLNCKAPDGHLDLCKWCRQDARNAAKLPSSARTLRSPEHLRKVRELKAVCPPGMKVCVNCLAIKPLDAFHNHKGLPDDKQSWCKVCMAADHKKKAHEYTLKYAHRLTQADYAQMLEAQGGSCFICRATNPRTLHGHFVVDHNHKTGEVRRLLCNNCNLALGHLGDSVGHAIAMARYLQAFERACHA